MRVLKTKEAILRAVPEITEEDVEQMNQLFTPYLFFKDHRDIGVRECWCSNCHAHFDYAFRQRLKTPEHYEFISTKHNEWTICPKCQRNMKAKETYRAKECINLEEWKRFVCVKPKGKDTVYLVCVYARKDYTGGDYLTKPEYNAATVYYLTPQSVRQFKRVYDYTFLGLRDGAFYETKRICEPFTKTYCYNISSFDKRGYGWIGLDRLKGTFLEYAPMDMFDTAYEAWWNSQPHYCFGPGESPDAKFLAYYAKYPSVEKLLKIDLGDFVCNLIDGRPMKRYIDWDAPTPKQMLGMRQDEFDDFRQHYYGMVDFQVYQDLRKVQKGFAYSQAVEIVQRYGGEASLRLAQAIKRHGLNLTKALHYLEKSTKGNKKSDFEQTAILWTDYLRFAKELKYDLKRDDVVFPKRLQKAHDLASNNYVAAMDEKEFKKYEKRYHQLSEQLAYSDGEYSIVIPKGVKDIVQEGKTLSHCVGGYAERHMRGATTIVFMRKCKEPQKRLVTVEVDTAHKQILQSRGYQNRNLTPKEHAFLEKWITWVRAGSKHSKEKKNKKAVEAA